MKKIDMMLDRATVVIFGLHLAMWVFTCIYFMYVAVLNVV